MATVRGRSEVKSYMVAVPGKMKSLLRGAARAGAKVIVEEAKVRSISQAVDEALVTETSGDDTRVVAKVSVKPGWSRSVAIWLEYGTAPHFISVDPSEKIGMSVRRANKQIKAESLMIGGKFVGQTVFHPGARAHPFLRSALDAKEGEAIAAARNYITSRVTRAGIAPSDDSE